MRKLTTWGLLLTAVSALPIVQGLREDEFWRAGAERFEEKGVRELPVLFAGRTITIEDPLPRGGPPSEAEERSQARVLLDGQEVLPADFAMVRPGRSDLGRYHLWIDAWIFTDRRTGEKALYLGRRLSAPAHKARPYDLLLVSADGSYRLRRLSFADRAESFPIWRTIQFLNDGTESVYPFSLSNVWPTVLVPVFYPNTTLALGPVMLLIGLWLDRRRRSDTSAAGGPRPTTPGGTS